jgi:hypothetical protein
VDDGNENGYPQQHQTLVVTPVGNQPLRLQVIGFEDDDPGTGDAGHAGNVGGIGDELVGRIIDGFWEDLGTLSDLAKSPGKHSYHKPDWWFEYYVTSVVLGGVLDATSAYWQPRLEDERRGNFPLGEMTVTPNASSTVIHDAYLLRDLGIRPDNTKLLGPDKEDLYQFSLSDFADVTINATGAVQHELVSTDLGYPYKYFNVPKDLQQMLGYRSAVVKVSTPPDVATDQEYMLHIEAKYKILPPDPGEPFDATGGRLMDLRTPDLKAKVYSDGSRSLVADWAWQHVPGDEDVYNILVPQPPAGITTHIPCPFDQPAKLDVSAPAMQLDVGGKTFTSEFTLKQKDFHTGEINVVVRNPSPTGRGIYQLHASWTPTKLFNPGDCAAILKHFKDIASTGPLRSIDPLPHPDPATPIEQWVEQIDFGSSMSKAASIRAAAPIRTLEILVASESGLPLRARLYTRSGVLVAEGVAAPDGAGLAQPLSSELLPQQSSRREMCGLVKSTFSSSRPKSAKRGGVWRGELDSSRDPPPADARSRFHHASRRCGGLAARGACAATADTGGRVSPEHGGYWFRTHRDRVPPVPERG